MRLIDADAFIDFIRNLPKEPNGFSKSYDESAIVHFVENQPTAFDADMVYRQMRREAEEVERSDTMRIEIEIPKEFEAEYKTDKFNQFFSRVMCDIEKGALCGNYERETADMLLSAFWESKVAYDVEAVVAELEKESYIETADDMNPYPPSKVVSLRKAISIVRGKE